MANENQRDELLALEAVYADDEHISLHMQEHSKGKEDDETLSIVFDIALDLAEHLLLQSGEEQASVVSLPLQLRLRLPKTYLATENETASAAPEAEVCAPWLSRGLQQQFSKELDRLWLEQTGDPILFVWTEWLRSEAFNSLGLGSELDLEKLEESSEDDRFNELTEISEGDQDLQHESASKFQLLISWDRSRRPPSASNCSNCDCCVEGGSAGLCADDHVICKSCMAILRQLYGAAQARCPSPECHAKVDMKNTASATRERLEEDLYSRCISGSHLETSVVLCPRCEDLGVDTPVLTSGDTIRLAAGVIELCTCTACGIRFCGVCRSPYHPTEECIADVGRARRLLRRRPPLPPGSKTDQATRLVRDADLRILSVSDIRSKANALQSQAVADTQKNKKSLAESQAAEDALLKTLEIASNTAHETPDKILWEDVYDTKSSEAYVQFNSLRWDIVAQYENELFSSLRGFISPVRLRPAPLAHHVMERFMHAVKAASGSSTKMVRPAFHGSAAKNYPSIFERGLLIPGDGNELRIVHGAAHGHGVYTANVDAAWLSAGFCDQPHMLVCAVLDDECVRHVGDAMVVGQANHVAPIFEAYGGRPRLCQHLASPVVQPAVQPVPTASSKSGKPVHRKRAEASVPTQEKTALEGTSVHKEKNVSKVPKKKSFTDRLAARSKRGW